MGGEPIRTRAVSLSNRRTKKRRPCFPPENKSPQCMHFTARTAAKALLLVCVCVCVCRNARSRTEASRHRGYYLFSKFHRCKGSNFF